MHDYCIELARSDDLAALPAIERAAAGLLPEALLPSALRQHTLAAEHLHAGQREARLWVAREAAGAPVGFALGEEVDGQVLLAELDVHPAHTRRGLGAALLNQVIAWAAARDQPALYLTTFSAFAPSAALYRRAGFVALGRAETPPFLLAILAEEQAAGLNERHALRRPLTPAIVETAMNVRLIDRRPTELAYLRHLGAYGEPISRFWQEQVFAWMATNNLLGRARYGISHDDPAITAAAQCRYDACVEVAADEVLTGDALRTTLPGGRYAVLAFSGEARQIGAAWDALLLDWLPSSGLQLDARPCFEHYPTDAACDPQRGLFACEICIPVVPL
ncbi:GNAT family N-acetyltransferase [Pseudomonas sp. UL073]|uniref:GNAT family N-acetyltransferase n=1 Tax=Zestomonas insulae TaxID=2809017 RepID=A0ABS2ICN0_9GAMM|nr:GNAT family N-acetyltransferase [Pseudomonas insulae]MBM7060059.1 GNAT family N-acetyltransferase [Pseudomonas insulae]